MDRIRYVRLQRRSTDSWLTYQLEWLMGFEAACLVLEKRLPGWEAVSASVDNPDEELAS